MNKLWIAALATGLALASATSVAATKDGGFFINAGVGQAQYHVGRTDGLGYKLDDKDTAGALRFGYYWRGPVKFGIEAGYVDLGKVVDSYNDGTYTFHDDIEAKGWMLGVNATHRFESPWYVEVRGGALRSTLDATSRFNEPGYSGYGSGNATGTGWYAGVGGGYDFTNDFSMGVHYDNYHVKAEQGGDTITGNVSTFMVQLEYRY